MICLNIFAPIVAAMLTLFIVGTEDSEIFYTLDSESVVVDDSITEPELDLEPEPDSEPDPIKVYVVPTPVPAPAPAPTPPKALVPNTTGSYVLAKIIQMETSGNSIEFTLQYPSGRLDVITQDATDETFAIAQNVSIVTYTDGTRGIQPLRKAK